ncbi:hypothetical protein [Sphingobium sp. B12D2B]|uniref:hypothetical protein n=1 Tax=Sphingobium sp. B12D2B TaxID=2940577 RepID=UPI0022253C94|nr:hypothetical protein [Sphingobium sp. B12D2B]MCW2349808.1 hypothetical protein [Sphingobium sp. B12D2B]
MKSFIGGVVGAVIAGLILFFAQQYWTKQQNSQQSRVLVDKRGELTFSKEELNKLVENFPGYGVIHITNYSISNTGEADIENKSLSIPNRSVISYEMSNPPNENPNNATISHDDNVLSVSFKILPKGEKTEFWFASSDSTFLKEFSADSTGLVVTNSEDIRSEVPFPWYIVGMVGLSLVFLILGVIGGQAALADELKKRGINVKELLSEPNKQSAAIPSDAVE